MEVESNECLRESENGWVDESHLSRLQKEEPWIVDIRKYIKGESTHFPAFVRIDKKKFVLVEEVLYVKEVIREDEINYRVALPKKLIKQALRSVHSSPLSGHMGVDKTLRKAHREFFWVGMKEDVTILWVVVANVCAIRVTIELNRKL